MNISPETPPSPKRQSLRPPSLQVSPSSTSSTSSTAATSSASQHSGETDDTSTGSSGGEATANVAASSCVSARNATTDDKPEVEGRVFTLPWPEFNDIFLTGDVDAEDLASRVQANYSALVNAMTDKSAEVIANTSNLLNTISRVYEEDHHVHPHERIEFVDHSRSPLLHHPRTSPNPRAQLIAVATRIAQSWRAASQDGEPSQIAWHHVLTAVHFDESGVEDESDEDGDEDDADSDADVDSNDGDEDDDGQDDADSDDSDAEDDRATMRTVLQSKRFLSALHQARPDLPGCLCLVKTHRTARLMWSDPTGAYLSYALKWSDPLLLVSICRFVARLHRPLLVDATVRLEDSFPPCSCSTTAVVDDKIHQDQPVWLVEDDRGTVYRAEKVLAVGSSWGRQNWVAAAMEHRPAGARRFTACPRVVIKDSWPRIIEEPACEDAVLQHIHSDGVVPGVCRLLAAFIVPGALGHLETVAVEDTWEPRRKHRMVMDGTGEDLYSCTSILEFLKVMYDGLEVLKGLHARRGVMHRDISPRNIMRASPNGECHETTRNFIGDILAFKYPAMRSGPAAVIIDFDNAYWEGKTPEDTLATPVGTPAFASRTVSCAFGLKSGEGPPPIEPLTGSAYDCYVRACGEERHDEVTALHDSDSIIPFTVLPPDRARYNPRHDAESCFWVIVGFFCSVVPENAGPDQRDPTNSKRLRAALYDHKFDPHFDSRDFIPSISSRLWPSFVHSALSEFGDFLGSLAALVRPSYDFFEPPLDPYHLHEAMQRLILREICRILDTDSDIALDTHRHRTFETSCAELPQVHLRSSCVQSGHKRRGLSIERSEIVRRRLR
ncbi:hypothetical protein EXIGLDRAFT_835191 [Exidia glandulosa HHB12029]|uniref:Fungal-type protein kinase domain-containing protein n=1 Tax=Exidia glandulosa HHB12029 TaxID=1314781 RepID=A0A165IZK9_EXIGL|nr:hypothetical protein EXIGLDRAFT_835191 [Exidia glandulosa HHB12029]